jgi:hypothetical protein
MQFDFSPSPRTSHSYSFVYLVAACLPLNVVENQTIIGRLCRRVRNFGNNAGHCIRTADKQL